MADVVTINKEDIIGVDLAISRIKTGSNIAIIRATNDALTGVRTDATKQIYEKVNLKQTIIRKAFKIKKMYQSDMSANIACNGNPLPLINFGARQTNKGVTLKVLRQGARDTVRHAFISTMKSGHKGVFWREGRRKGKRPSRFKIGKRTTVPSPRKRSGEEILKGEGNFQLPIHELYGPRVPDVFDDREVMEPVLQKTSIRFDDRLKHHTDRLLKDAGA